MPGSTNFLTGWLTLANIPSISALRHLGKIDNVVDLTKTYGHIDNFADANGIIRKVTKSDVTKKGWNMIQDLAKTSDGFTISSLEKGRDIHETFMNGGRAINRFNKVDGINDALKVIYELKPYNKRGIKKGIKQLYRYRDELIKAGEGLYKMILVLY